MAFLNLVNPDQSEISYKISRFPDGQQNIELDSDVSRFDDVLIQSRLNNWKDLELIVAANQCLKRAGINNVSLFAPYLVGARSDRKFVNGGNNYLADVLAPVINLQGFTGVSTLDVHSDVAEACINNFHSIPNYFISEVVKEVSASWVCPDAGAVKKIFSLAKRLNYNGDIITCSKVRDEQGNLSQTYVPKVDATAYLIIDDICDGGRTFINIAKELRAYSESPVYLAVTHGIFSAGFDELEKYFEQVYCTNSYSDVSHKLIKQFKVC
jgi:ribose-phosphate pyrophosphokinase